MDNRANAPRPAQEDATALDSAAPDALLWRLACYSVIGLFALALLAALQIASDLVVPILSALVVGAVLARLIDRLVGFGLHPGVAGAAVVATAIALGVLLINALIEPFSAFIAQAPQMAQALLRMAEPVVGPLGDLKNLFVQPGGEGAPVSIGAATSWLASFLGRLTPALGELLVFFAALAFFVAGRSALRKKLVLAMPARESRLRALRAFGAVEDSLALYFGAATLVYAGVGAATALVAFAGGLSNPLLWGAMTFAAAYIPYFGVALISISLAASGLMAHPHSLFALAPALAYLAIHMLTELFVIPTLLGRRHEINPFLVFLSIVFWSWMWGPVGAILAAPLLLMAQSLIGVMAKEEAYLP